MRIQGINREVQNEYQVSISTLYSIEPIGLGTPYVESLTSYIARLAYEHSVTTGSLMKKVITNYLTVTHLKNNYMKGSISKDASTLCSIGIGSENIISILEMLTGRKDIIFTTLMSLKGLLYGENIISKYKKWCPQCLQEFIDKNKIVYEPLIWQIISTQHCSKHYCKLRDECHRCNKRLKSMHSKYIVGFCHYCNAWLGEKIKAETVCSLSSEENIMHEIFCGVYKYNYCLLPNHINSIINKLYKFLNLKMHDFMNLFGLKREGTITSWINYGSSPRKWALINFCINTKSSFVNIFIKGDFKEIEYLVGQKKIVRLDERNFDIKKNVPSTRLNLTELYDMLTDNLMKEVPLNLAQIKRKYKIGRLTMKKYFPELYNKTKERCSYRISKGEMEEITFELKDSDLSLATVCRRHGVEYRQFRRVYPEIFNKLEEYSRKKREGRRKYKHDLLLKIVTKELDIELTVYQIEKKYGFKKGQIEKQYPNLFKLIKTRHIRYSENEKNNRRAKLFELLHSCIIGLHEQGVYPSQNKIQEHLKDKHNIKALFRRKEIVEYRKEVLKGLGYILK
ncbi:TniQ family protein [Bacillus mycoides]|uniref:TniQ family protein n=1 Tax=Bacillus mycoides TaxID=1405 RepID=UPI0011A05F6E|nr:TniQ family protein [Bacillus mycoides]